MIQESYGSAFGWQWLQYYPAFSPYINISTSHSSACSTTFSINVWRSFGQIWHKLLEFLNFIGSHDSDCLDTNAQCKEQKSTKPKWKHEWINIFAFMFLKKCTSPPPPAQSQQRPAQQAAQQSVSAAAASATWPTDLQEKLCTAGSLTGPRNDDRIFCLYCRSISDQKKYNVCIYLYRYQKQHIKDTKETSQNKESHKEQEEQLRECKNYRMKKHWQKKEQKQKNW